MVPKLRILNIAQNFAFLQIQGCWFQIWQYFFKLTTQNTQIRQFWFQNWFYFFVLHAQFFAFWQILGCWFQISQSFFLSFRLKIPKRTFLVSNSRTFIFAWNFFKFTTQNCRNTVFLVPKLELFVLHDFPFHKFEGAHSK